MKLLKQVRIRTATTIIIVLSVLTFSLPLKGFEYASASSIAQPDRRTPNTSCALCPSEQRNLDEAEKLATLGRVTQVQPFMPILRSVFEGMPVNFVSTATGTVSFQVSDLKLEGQQPLEFARVYSSDRSEDRGLGRGWSFTFDERITINDSAAVMTTGAGLVLNFRREGSGPRFTLTTPEPHPHQSFQIAANGEIVEETGGFVRIYRKAGTSHRLAEISDQTGKRITMTFNARGNLRRIATDSGTALNIEWAGGKNARMLSVTDNSGRRVSFTQSNGLLRSVIDPAGEKWSYTYNAGLLSKAIDPMDRTLLRVDYNQSGQATASGDAVGSSAFEYEMLGKVSQRTVVTDPMGRRSVYQHNGLGALIGFEDAGGKLLTLEYNSANQPEVVSDSDGVVSRFKYDPQNRLTHQSSAGREKTFTYDERGAVASSSDGEVTTTYANDQRGGIEMATSSDPAGSYRAARNERKQLMSITSEAGQQISYEYDLKGNQTAVTYAGVGRFEREFDSTGRKVAERMPSGLAYAYTYDARGALTRHGDNNGRSVTMEHDKGGALVRLITSDSSWVRATRDAAGRIVKLTRPSGKSRHFAYDASGALIEFTDADGRRKTMKYDHKGRLESITNAEGVSSRYSYNRAGKLVGVHRDAKTEARAFRVMPVKFEPRAMSSPARPQFECFGWFEGDSFYAEFGFGCDPFGGFGGGGGGGGGGFGGGGYLGGESCQACMNRQYQICEANRVSCLQSALAAHIVAAGACIILTGGTAAIICAAAALAAYHLSNMACNNTAYGCQLSARNNCPSC